MNQRKTMCMLALRDENGHVTLAPLPAQPMPFNELRSAFVHIEYVQPLRGFEPFCSLWRFRYASGESVFYALAYADVEALAQREGE